MTETTVYKNDHIEIKHDPGFGAGDEAYRLYSLEQNTLTCNDFLDDDDMEALRGYFQAEEDKRLNRWRYPSDPTLVVYPTPDNPLTQVWVVNESSPWAPILVEKWRLRVMGPEDRAAEAYFKAHPEPKPWHDAKEGEAWVLTTFNRAEPALVTSVRGAEVLRFSSTEYNIPVTSDTITAGYRIHPKEDS